MAISVGTGKLKATLVLVESVTGYDGRVSGMFVSNLSGSGELL